MPRRPIEPPIAKPDARDLGYLRREVKRLREVQASLEHQLTLAVQEIGVLRQFEWRTSLLQREVQKREDEIARLRRDVQARAPSPGTAAG